ncbi:MAG TPA: hypothetical protein VM056_02860 [Terriglobales bacterium]|nr:hypothetical protein [Terriglobales bacterium]
MTFEEAALFLDKTVMLRLHDGEVSKVKIVWVSDEYQDITVDVLETNNTVNYHDPKAAYVIPVADIKSIEEIST